MNSAMISKPAYPHLGDKMLRNMGWIEDTPLGCRGSGILKPVEASVFRKPGDHTGLGYQESQPKKDNIQNTTITISAVKERYGVANTEFGTTFISNGAMKHIWNLTGYSIEWGYTKSNLIGLRISADIVRGMGSHTWRVARVNGIEQCPFQELSKNPTMYKHSIFIRFVKP